MAPHDLRGGAAMPGPNANADAWLQAHVARMCRSLGLVLTSRVSPMDRLWAAQYIDRFFNAGVLPGEPVSDDLAVSQMLALMRRADDRPDIDLDAFEARLRSLDLPSPESFDGGVVARNLAVLPLTVCERKRVLWAYCAECDPSFTLRGALLQIAVDPADAAAFLALLLDEPISAIRSSLATPSRLHALGLIDSPDLGMHTLSSYLSALQPLRAALETDHGSTAGLLYFLRRPALPWFLEPAHDVPPGMLDEWFDPALADAMRSEMAHRPQTAVGLAALVRWSCGWSVPIAACEPLAGRLDLQAIQTAVAVLAASLPAGEPLTGSAVMAALASAR